MDDFFQIFIISRSTEILIVLNFLYFHDTFLRKRGNILSFFATIIMKKIMFFFFNNKDLHPCRKIVYRAVFL